MARSESRIQEQRWSRKKSRQPRAKSWQICSARLSMSGKRKYNNNTIAILVKVLERATNSIAQCIVKKWMRVAVCAVWQAGGVVERKRLFLIIINGANCINLQGLGEEMASLQYQWWPSREPLRHRIGDSKDPILR